MEQLLKRIEQFKSFKEDLKNEVKYFVKDKRFSLDDRWKLFVEAELGDHENYYHKPDGINWGRMTLYDDFYMDRYATTDAEYFIELCEDKIKEGDDINIEEVKEYFLENFIWSFKNDW